MFDFRYHVASLAAVFVALVIGILVGVGLSGKGFVDDAERQNLTNQISALKQERDNATALAGTVGTRQRALEEYAADSYPVLVSGRLTGRRVVVLFVGSVDQTVSFAVRQAVRDAGGRIIRVRALRVPMNTPKLQDALQRKSSFAALGEAGNLDDVGSQLAAELVAGSPTPLWDALAPMILDERDGASDAPADAIVVARPADPQHGGTHELLTALYTALARSGVPAVGVDPEGRTPGALPAFSAAGLSTVDSVNTPAGRLAVVLLLAGGEPGSYGVGQEARDGALPPLARLPASG